MSACPREQRKQRKQDPVFNLRRDLITQTISQDDIVYLPIQLLIPLRILMNHFQRKKNATESKKQVSGTYSSGDCPRQIFVVHQPAKRKHLGISLTVSLEHS